jgi:ribonuclease P protein component
VALTTLRKSADFERVFAERKRFFREGLGFYVSVTGTEDFRYGLVAPRRFGNAVHRNKFRRRVRELIRRNRRIPTGIDFVVCVYKPFAELGFDLLSRVVDWAVERARKMRPSPSPQVKPDGLTVLA